MLTALATLAACGGGDDPAGGPVDARYMANGDAMTPCGAARERDVYAPVGSTVVFHTPSGAIQDVLTIADDSGVGEVAWPCTDITVAVDRARMITVRRAWNSIYLGRQSPWKPTDPRDVSIEYPAVPGAQAYTFSTGLPCSTTTWSTASPATLALGYECANGWEPIVAIARGHGGIPIAYATTPWWTDDQGELVAQPIRSWRTDVPARTITIEAPPGWDATYRVLLAYSSTIWRLDPRTLVAVEAPSGTPVALPPVGNEVFLQQFATGNSNVAEYLLEWAGPLDGDQLVDMRFPYLPITKTDDGQPRPTIAWSAAGPLTGLEVVSACAYWASPEPREWCVVDDPARTSSISFPALPPSLAFADPPTSTGLTFRGAGIGYDQWLMSLMIADATANIGIYQRVDVGDDPEHTSLPTWYLDP